MKTTRRRTKTAARDEWEEVGYLYRKVLYWFYERADRSRARFFADRLAAQFRSMGRTGSILEEECWSLVFEVKGSLREAIKHRLLEIEKIQALWNATSIPPRKDQVGYDAADLSDRLDILAALYHEAGRFDEAIEALRESQRVCEAHGVCFQGEEMLNEYLAHRDQCGTVPTSSSSPGTASRLTSHSKKPRST